MGRPRFKIDTDRLRGLREEKNLTQETIAKKVTQLLGKPTSFHLRHYQRVERNGKTSRQYAKALASILDVSVPLLQGSEAPEPREYLGRIQQLLKIQLDKGAHQELQNLLEQHIKGGYSKDEALKFLTEDVAGNIENMQLVRNPDEVQRLIQLTGLSESELLSPAYLYGFWFLSVSSSKNRRITEVTSAVGKRIDEEIQEYLNSWELGSTVCMWRDKPWFRIKITRPQIQDGGMRIDFTRCKPSATGLEWIEAGWRDEFFLLDQIADYAYRTADFVTDFSNKTSPGDVYRLRLVVTERTHYMTSPKKNRLMVVNGRGDKIPEWIKEGRAERYESRSLFLDSLASQLEVALIPHLAKHPDWPWMVFNNDSSVVIESENRSPLRFSVAECWILRYEICLKEEVAPGVFDRVPVRVKEMQALKERLEKRLKELDKACIPPTDDQPVPDFEPV